MKKVAILTSVAAVALLSGVASAALTEAQLKDMQDGVDVKAGDAILIDKAAGNGYADNIAPRDGVINGSYGNQFGIQEVKMVANIPCYLEFRFTGNDMNDTMKSFGYDTKAISTANSTNYIAFIPSVSGFLKSSPADSTGWTWVEGSTHKNANIEPGLDTYIRACDTFVADIWSNMAYKYDVKVDDGGLKKSGNASVLPVYMRSAVEKSFTAPTKDFASLTASDWGATQMFKGAVNGGAPVETINVATADALQYTRAFHQFKVPYSRDFVAGDYFGKITFTAATVQ